jgi:hypothetical protein
MEYKRLEEIPTVWEDPPAPPAYRSPSHYRGAILDRFRRDLLAQSGRWAVYPTEGLENDMTEGMARTHARSINKGLGKWGDFPWEAKAVDGVVYVRSVAPPEGA